MVLGMVFVWFWYIENDFGCHFGHGFGHGFGHQHGFGHGRVSRPKQSKIDDFKRQLVLGTVLGTVLGSFLGTVLGSFLVLGTFWARFWAHFGRGFGHCFWLCGAVFLGRLWAASWAQTLGVWVFRLKLATSNPGIHAIGRWAKYPGLGPPLELMCAFYIARCPG